MGDQSGTNTIKSQSSARGRGGAGMSRGIFESEVVACNPQGFAERRAEQPLQPKNNQYVENVRDMGSKVQEKQARNMQVIEGEENFPASRSFKNNRKKVQLGLDLIHQSLGLKKTQNPCVDKEKALESQIINPAFSSIGKIPSSTGQRSSELKNIYGPNAELHHQPGLSPSQLPPLLPLPVGVKSPGLLRRSTTQSSSSSLTDEDSWTNDDRIWFYRDSEDAREKGPAAFSEILTWLKRGYFNLNLQVRRDASERWHSVEEPVAAKKSQAAIASSSPASVKTQSLGTELKSGGTNWDSEFGSNVDDDMEIVFSLYQEWYYFDEHENIQGPFSGRKMAKWWKKGFLPPSTRCWHSPEGEFVSLGDLQALLPHSAAHSVQSRSESSTRSGSPVSRLEYDSCKDEVKCFDLWL